MNGQIYLVLENKRYIPFLLAWHKTIEQHRKTTDKGLRNGPRPCLGDDHVTGCHPFWHVVHKAFDRDLYSSYALKPQQSSDPVRVTVPQLNSWCRSPQQPQCTLGLTMTSWLYTLPDKNEGATALMA